MTTSTLKLISDSAEDFANIVWPHIIKTPLVGGGTLLPVEAQTSEGFSDILDLIAGIDVLQFSKPHFLFAVLLAAYSGTSAIEVFLSELY